MPTPSLLHPKYRKDIDGLRAIAVLSVVIFHAFPHSIKGGFIGVDVFFVISGYLISTIIFKNLDHGRFSFFEFYVRRINRIFPDLILILMFCYIFGWFALLSDEYMKMGKYILGGALFISNFILYNENGYFDDASEVKPLLHLWSLSIEEQFYIFCPIILWSAFKKKFNILSIVLLFCAISFYFNIKIFHSNTVADFYFPQTRFWELLSGSVLAWFMLYKPEFSAHQAGLLDKWLAYAVYRSSYRKNNGTTLANTISTLGCLLLAYGFCKVDRNIEFPGYYALIPVVSTVLIIFSGPEAWINRKILSNKFIAWFGLISFPLYLWHWPLLSLARLIQGETPPEMIRAGIMVASLALAWLTYKFIERPLRFGGNQSLKAGLYVISMIIVGFLGYKSYYGNGLPDRLKNFNEKNKAILSQLVVPPKLLRNVQCTKYFSSYKGSLCVLKNNSAPEILLIGDSHALQYYSGIANNIKEKNIGMLGGGWTTPALNPLIGAYKPSDAYYEIQKQIYDIISSNNNISSIVIGCLASNCMNENFEINLHNTLNFLTKINKNVTILIDPPNIPFDVRLCLYTRPFRLYSNVKNPCAFPIKDYVNQIKKHNESLSRVLSDYPSVKVFDPSRYLCDEKYCYAVIKQKLLYRNSGENSHLSEDGSEFFGPLLSQAVLH